MKKSIKLKNAITIDGKEVSELSYDTNAITGILFVEAEARRKAAAGRKNVAIVPAAEFDYGLHLYCGYAAIIAANSKIDFTDLERIHGADVVEIMDIGRNFILRSEEQASTPTDEQPGSTADTSTQA